ncbi:MAG: HypC/HybG/HupF family hydrogenase formation chaperone [Bryobacteraceae bacterium]|nr:HypC/HybG/HupF family hydrogenase formation chaperone [Bryobacteraceae bacterium]MDW8380421.1 HypC/HybG/HupF family hydrogenase formation chaperone [Bryobacterales bacterium]
MCLAIPGKVLSVEGEQPALRRGRVDFGGIRKEIRFAFTPEVQPGNYVLVHAGFALRIIDEAEAERSQAALEEALAEWTPGDSPASNSSLDAQDGSP